MNESNQAYKELRKSRMFLKRNIKPELDDKGKVKVLKKIRQLSKTERLNDPRARKVRKPRPEPTRPGTKSTPKNKTEETNPFLEWQKNPTKTTRNSNSRLLIYL